MLQKIEIHSEKIELLSKEITGDIARSEKILVVIASLGQSYCVGVFDIVCGCFSEEQILMVIIPISSKFFDQGSFPAILQFQSVELN